MIDKHYNQSAKQWYDTTAPTMHQYYTEPTETYNYGFYGGFSADGLHKDTGTPYDPQGFDIDGWNINGSLISDEDDLAWFDVCAKYEELSYQIYGDSYYDD